MVKEEANIDTFLLEETDSDWGIREIMPEAPCPSPCAYSCMGVYMCVEAREQLNIHMCRCAHECGGPRATGVIVWEQRQGLW